VYHAVIRFFYDWYFAMMPNISLILSRFRSFYTELDFDKCWEWGGSVDRENYGTFNLSFGDVYALNHNFPRQTRAHRFAYALKYPFVYLNNKKLLVCHRCDNPLCVNPHHLFMGTDKDNAVDKAKKNRTGRNKLLRSDIILIRKLYEQGYSCTEIAKRFPVGRQHIQKIVTNTKWTWI
jgi:hypothetical protein